MMTNYGENESDPCRSVNTIPAQTEPNGYQQALEDFGITELLEKLSHFQANDFDAQPLHPEPEELESVAALLIQQLTNSQASLYRTLLTRANISQANLRGANLFKASLNDANLTQADLTGAKAIAIKVRTLHP